ncbi:MAG: hypothetical protein J5693_01315 [Bacteroidales bacterium]|nr:hypothetical protein [Bacteroidales bacterium]
MKRILSNALITALALILFGCNTYDDTGLRDTIDGYESRISDLETRLLTLENSFRELTAYQALLQKLNSSKTVIGYSESDGEITLIFSDNSTITFNQKGEKGDPGEPGESITGPAGVSPIIKNEEGKWWISNDGGNTWTESGSSVGSPGATGGQGPQGPPGPQGQPGVTPSFQINEETMVWEVSYDDGTTWKEIGSAVDRSLISDVSIGQDGESITFCLADGSSIIIPCVPQQPEGSGLRIPFAMRDNMVLQQNTAANIWGWADQGSKVSVTVSWSEKRYIASAGYDGLWKVAVATPAASFSPQWVTVTCGSDTVTIENILIGEVWLCSGQSNMEMPVAGLPGQPTENSGEYIQEAYQYPEVRMFMAQKTSSVDKLEDVRGEWRCADGGHVREFSAVAYFFGRELARELKVPIGLIVPCWGGSFIECWMDREALLSVGLTEYNIDQNILTYADNSPAACCTALYNGMIHPLRHFTINGFIWYQGCSNVSLIPIQDYARFQAAMVTRWRKLFDRTDIPFYYVQIAPYRYGGEQNTGNAPVFRERQKAAASLAHNCAMVATCDLVYENETDVIHPRRKAEVGQRLANLALEHWYGMDGCHSDSPDLENVIPQGSSAKVVLSHCEGGLHSGGGYGLNTVTGFEVAGSDKIWHPAYIREAAGNTITVASDNVADVQYVRYLWHDFAIGYLWNEYNLPLLPFTSESL